MTKNITVNIALNGEIDVAKLAEEFKASLRKEIERVGVSVTTGGFRKVSDRKPRVGDYVKTDRTGVLRADVTAGKYYEVTEDIAGDVSFVDDVGDERLLGAYQLGYDYEVYEKVGAETAPEVFHHAFKVGDYAKVIATSNSMLGFSVGETVQIVGKSVGKHKTAITNGSVTGYGDEGVHFIQIAEEQATQSALKVGDYIVATSADRYGITNTRMKLGKVTEIRAGDYVKIEVVAHENSDKQGRTYSVESKYFRKATDEEIAEATTAAKWTAIGRKPNEFKKGDIVRGERRLGDGRIVEGIVEDIEKSNPLYLGIIPFNEADGYYAISATELIAPVEARFDARA